jgi:hypothetical protein
VAALGAAQGQLTREPTTMPSRLSRWLTPFAVLAVTAASAGAQDETGPTHAPPVLGYFLAFLFTVLALVVVCMPTRKS